MTPAHDLGGRGVLVTRPADQAEPLCRLIEAANGRPIPFPTIEIIPARDPRAAQDLLAQPWDLMVFISRNAVEHAVRLTPAAAPWGKARLLAAVGRATAIALGDAGRPPDLVPGERYDSETLLALPELARPLGWRVLIVRGEGGRATLADTLAARGAEVTYAEVYRRSRPEVDAGPLIARWPTRDPSAHRDQRRGAAEPARHARGCRGPAPGDDAPGGAQRAHGAARTRARRGARRGGPTGRRPGPGRRPDRAGPARSGRSVTAPRRPPRLPAATRRPWLPTLLAALVVLVVIGAVVGSQLYWRDLHGRMSRMDQTLEHARQRQQAMISQFSEAQSLLLAQQRDLRETEAAQYLALGTKRSTAVSRLKPGTSCHPLNPARRWTRSIRRARRGWSARAGTQRRAFDSTHCQAAAALGPTRTSTLSPSTRAAASI